MRTTPVRLPGLLVVVLALAVLLTGDTAMAQKKKKEAAPQATAVQTVPQTAMKGSGTIREVLAGLQGTATNLGTLTKLAGDYVVFDNDGDTVMYPLAALQSVKLLKPDEEGGERHVEIRFLNKD
jgi:hypothetical protein